MAVRPALLLLLALATGSSAAAGTPYPPAPVSAGTSAADSVRSHVLYVHGWIVQDRQEARPEHPRFGTYDLPAILAVFRRHGDVVTGEIRPRDATVDAAADRLTAQVRELLAAGVPPQRVAVVGASMGAAITLLAAARVGNPDVRYVVLGTCVAARYGRIRRREGRPPTGRILAIREASDTVVRDCPAWDQATSEPAAGTVREIVLHTGLDHGFLYRPLPAWVEPALAWIEDAGREAVVPGE